jgi:hypothetical protein
MNVWLFVLMFNLSDEPKILLVIMAVFVNVTVCVLSCPFRANDNGVFIPEALPQAM